MQPADDADGVDVVQGHLFGQPVPHEAIDFGVRQVLTKNVA